MIPDCFHRFIFDHNKNEKELVLASMEVWGRDAHTLAWGLCVQAYPHSCEKQNSYVFGTGVEPKLKLGFLDRKPVVREAVWNEGMDGVEYRDNGDAVSIPVLWVEPNE